MDRRVILAQLIPFLFLFSILSGCEPEAPPVIEKPPAVVRIDQQAGTITINVKNASLFELLATLEKEHDLAVTIPGLESDRTITVNVTDIPLDQGLRLLIPSDLEFRFTPKKYEVVLTGETGDKKPSKSTNIKSFDLPTKGKTKDIPPFVQRGLVKGAPVEKIEEKYTSGKDNTKVEPSKIAGIVGEGAKKPKKKEPEKELYVRVNLFMASDNTIRVERVIPMQGRLVQLTTYNGRFFHVARMGDEIVAVGSMQDPLLVRSIDEKPGRLTTRAESGYFSISLPSSFADKQALESASLQFYLLEEDLTELEKVTPEDFAKVEKKLKSTAEVDGKALLKAFADAK